MGSYLTENILNCPRCTAKLDQKSDFASCGGCNFTYYQNPAPCTTLLIYEKGRVLLAKRAIEPRKNYWDLPGGFIDLNESAEEGALREGIEETGLKLEITNYLGSDHDIYGETKVPTLNFFFKVKIIEGEPKAQDDVSELKWFDLDNLPSEDQFAFANDITGIDLLKKKA